MTLKPHQIKSNPKNPRVIQDDKFKRLVKSLQDFPEMADVRQVVVNQDNMILGGNMRFKAMIAAGWKEIPVRKVDWPEDKQQEFIIKDNASSGDWDFDKLANEWDSDLLKEWGALGNTFEPKLNPNFGADEVNKEQIEKRAQELADQMVKQRSKVDTICPACGEEFQLQL